MFLQFFIVAEISLLCRTAFHCSSLRVVFSIKKFLVCFVNYNKKESQVMHLECIFVCLYLLSSITNTQSGT